jgi:PhnB protein
MSAEGKAKESSNAVRPPPPGYHTVTPWIIARDAARLIEFLKAAFGAEERSRVLVGDNRIGHAELSIGDSVVMLFDAKPEWPDTPAFIRLYVQDADDAFARALRAGAQGVTSVAEHSFGDRVGRVRDPAGNVWWLQSHVRDVTPESMAHPTPAQADAMAEAMSSLDRELSARR